LVPATYEFLNVDVEGNNLAVLQSLLVQMRGMPLMVCVEMDPQKDVPYMKELLVVSGLRNQQEFGGNLLAWK
jgi:hypothetical protein